ncbi:Nudix family hydrolase [Orrella sp. JC864]|uniref:Nudix family hydrolase n=1 Tax=Orrella sp. JC864 TaxID=3120298 RepID=UPI0012BBCC72
MAEKIVDVAVGLILRADGQLLLGDRPTDKSWPGWWELPGGKIEPGETVMQALARELDEELGIRLTEARPWVTYVHAYPHTTVKLSFCIVTGWENQPVGREGQQLRWIAPAQALAMDNLLPAAYPPLRWLLQPDRYGITGVGQAQQAAAWFERLDQALARGLKLVQFREPGWPGGPADEGLRALLQQVVARCHARGAGVLLNSVHPQAWLSLADGLHLRAQDAARLAERPGLPEGALLAVSAHDAADLEHARRLKADFAVLGPVLPTDSHPERPALGWDRFALLNEQAGLPVLALGGQSEATFETARRHGAHGIAGIRGLI